MSEEEEDAVANLESFAGLDKRQGLALVKAIKRAATREALEVINGNAPIPSSMVDLRAYRLCMICQEAGRVLRPREVEVVFRLPPNTALNVDRRMRATYPRAVEGFLREIIKEMATVETVGESPDWRYRIYFDDPAGMEYALQLLQREGLTRDVRSKRVDQTLDMPCEMGPEGTDPLEVLGL